MTIGKVTGTVGYNVQTAVDDKHHLFVTHEVTNIGNDRKQLSKMSKQARKVMGTEDLTVVADRGYYNGEELLSCHEAGITTYVPNASTSGALAAGRFNRSEFH